MTEAVQIALITNVTVIVVAFLSRLWSHKEHLKTEAKVLDTNKKVTTILNGAASTQKHNRNETES